MAHDAFLAEYRQEYKARDLACESLTSMSPTWGPTGSAGQPGGLPHERVLLKLLRPRRRGAGHQPGHDAAVPHRLVAHRGLDLQDRLAAESLRRVARFGSCIGDRA